MKNSDEQNRPNSNESSGSYEDGSASNSKFLQLQVPTTTGRGQKRKHIKTDFEKRGLLNDSAQEAQRRERERLDRLRQTRDENEHIRQMAALRPAMVTPPPNMSSVDFDDFRMGGGLLDDFDDIMQPTSSFPSVANPTIDLDDMPAEVTIHMKSEFKAEEDDKKNIAAIPSTSTADNDIIELSSGEDDDDLEITGVFQPRRVAPPLLVPAGTGRRARWVSHDKDREAKALMDEQLKIEKERLKKRRGSIDLEKKDLTSGQLIVNTGHHEDEPDIAVAQHLTTVLQPHQLGGVRFMYDNLIESLKDFKSSPGFGCILAHSMGLGKTLQVITFTEIFLRVTSSQNHVLVITPVNTIQNWKNEYDQWMPTLTDAGNRFRQFEVFLLGDAVKSFDQRVTMLETWQKKGGVLLVGYDMFRQLIRATQPKKPTRPKISFVNGAKIERKEEVDDYNDGFTNEGRVKKEANQIVREALLDPGPDLVVCDEGHKIKNWNSDISMALSSIRTRRRVVLTGYPLQNNLMEYYVMVDFVRPMYLGTKKSFSIMFEKPIKNGQCVDSTKHDVKLAQQRTHVLTDMLRGFVQRRTHRLLKSILPESCEYVVLLRKSPLQHILYRNFILYATKEIKAGNSGMVFNPLKAFAACSKIWNHPDVLARTLIRRREERDKDSKKKQAALCAQADVGSTSNDGYSNGCSNASASWASSSGSASVFQPPPMTNFSAPLMPTNYGMPPASYGYGASSSGNGMTLANALNGSFSLNMTHNDLWGGLFGGSENSLPSSSSHQPQQQRQAQPSGSNVTIDSSTGDESEFALGFRTPTSEKKKKPRVSRKGNGKASEKETIAGVLMEENDIEMADQGLQYDWAEIAMDRHRLGEIENGYKMVIAMELLEESTKRGEKMLIFSQNLSALSAIEEFLEKRKLMRSDGSTVSWIKNQTYFRFDGSTSASDRERLIDRFNSDPNISLFLISTRAGSLGINLVSANRCIIFDACWNPCHDAQAVCRVYRYGQQKKTYIYRLILDNCMERAIFNRQISKNGLQQRVVDEAQVNANITIKELETLLIYDEAEDVRHNEWDTRKWQLNDEVLARVAAKHSVMLAAEPFLHESLIVEREESLSEQEKQEAKQLYEMEKEQDVLGMDAVDRMRNSIMGNGIGVARGSVGFGHSRSTGNFFNNNFDPNQPPPLRGTPLPLNLERVNRADPFGYSRGGATMAGAVGGFAGSARNLLHPTMMTPLGNGGEGQYSNRFPFPGAEFAMPPSLSSDGSIQRIRTDREFVLPVIKSVAGEKRAIVQGSDVLLVRTPRGTYLRLEDGTVLDAANTVLIQQPAPPPSSSTFPRQIQAVRRPNAIQMTDVIELD